MQAPRIVTQPALRLVGAQILTKPMSPEIPALWPRFAARIPQIASRVEPGVTWGAMQDIGDNLLYLAAVEVAPQAPAPLDMAHLEVAAGDVAVFEFPFGEIGQA